MYPATLPKAVIDGKMSSLVNEDYQAYLEWLDQYSQQHKLEVLAYCLMTSHVYLVVVPEFKDSLHLTLKPLHMRYAQRLNRKRGWRGHVWQGRYFSAPLDERYMWSAIRYVELNPVRAYMVEKAEDYPWSSAASHCGLRNDNILFRGHNRLKIKINVDDWSAWLVGKCNDNIKG